MAEVEEAEVVEAEVDKTEEIFKADKAQACFRHDRFK